MTTVAASSSRGVWEAGARAGYAVSGVLHVLIGVLAAQLATGGGGEDADQSGAFAQVASTPFGAVALWVAVVALAALGAWQGAAALSGAVGEAADRAKAAGKAVMYLALAATALTFARGSGSGGQTSDATASLVQAPGGRVLVGAVGVGVAVVGGYHVVKGVTKRFLRDLHRLPAGTAGRVARAAGVAGYVAKGVALVVVGVLFVLAAVQADPAEASGLDGALRTLRDAPAGPLLLGLVALGLVLFGLYSLVRARFGRL